MYKKKLNRHILKLCESLDPKVNDIYLIRCNRYTCIIILWKKIMILLFKKICSSNSLRFIRNIFILLEVHHKNTNKIITNKLC